MDTSMKSTPAVELEFKRLYTKC